MGKEEYLVRREFVNWASNQTPFAAILLPEASISGKKIDLVCVEEPFDAFGLRGRGSQLIRRFQAATWQTTYSSYGPSQGSKLLTIDNTSMDAIARQLVGKNVWLVELKQDLSYSALGQVLVYKHHFTRNHPEVPVSRCIIACTRTDSVIEEVCTEFGIETVELDSKK